MPFTSQHPDIDRAFNSSLHLISFPCQFHETELTSHLIVPTNITTWTWLFNSPASPLNTETEYKSSSEPIAGFRNAQTEERVSWSDVKTHTTHLSTALVKAYGLKKGDTVALFSPNTIWYPVAMLAVNRVAGVVVCLTFNIYLLDGFLDKCENADRICSPEQVLLIMSRR